MFRHVAAEKNKSSRKKNVLSIKRSIWYFLIKSWIKDEKRKREIERLWSRYWFYYLGFKLHRRKFMTSKFRRILLWGFTKNIFMLKVRDKWFLLFFLLLSRFFILFLNDQWINSMDGLKTIQYKFIFVTDRIT